MGILGYASIIICLFNAAFAQPPTDPSEVEALNKIIDHWNLRSEVNLTTDPCIKNAKWAPDTANPRIACDCTTTTCHITHLKIYALDIIGNIPKELFMLKELVDLNLGQNVLNGPIPPEIGQLTKMQYLSLGINNLSGLVPPELGNLINMISLSFSSNNFTGGLPKELGNLKSLTGLYIDSSGVGGPIPQELSNLKSLQTLWASDNLFSGKLPEFLGTFTDLIVMRFEGTMLEGPIPSNFGALKMLDDLRIGDLIMEDSSLDFVKNLTKLSILSLRNCRMAGKIPEELGTFTNLKTLDLSFNKLTGPIPNSLKDIVSLKYLYLGSNELSGELPKNFISPNLTALDVSFNSLSGNLPQNSGKVGLSLNVIGTSINSGILLDRKATGMLRCLQGNSKCSSLIPSTSFSIKCGGTEQVSITGVKFDDDSEILESASMYTGSGRQWAVTNTGNYISNPKGSQYIVNTESQISQTLESELYKSARTSPSSLRYYGFGLENGKYSVEIHFAEIQMEDSSNSWKGLGRRLFDVLIQGERVLKDFNIKDSAGGSKRALVRTFVANVTNTVIDIHLFWAGRGTCCIPFQSTYGPLVSAIHVSQVSKGTGSSKRDKKRAGKIAGIAIGCVAGMLITASLIYLWLKKDKAGHTRVQTDSPKK